MVREAAERPWRPFRGRRPGVVPGREAPRPCHRARGRRPRPLGAPRRRPRGRGGARRLARRQRIGGGVLGLRRRRGDRRRRVGRRAHGRALRERGTSPRTTGESEPLVALQDALATFRPTASSSSCAARTPRATARTTSSARPSGASASRHRDRPLIVRRRVSCASWRARQRSSTPPLARVHEHRPAQRFDPRRLLGQEGQMADELGCRLDRELGHRDGAIARARRRDRSS